MYRALKSGEDFFALVAHLAVAAHPLWGGWIAEVGTVSDPCYRRQQLRERAHSRRFARTSTSQMRTPPIDGSIALRMRASRIFCCSTIALNGNVVIFLPSRDAGYIFSCCQTQECCMLPPGQVSCQKHVLSCQITGIDR